MPFQQLPDIDTGNTGNETDVQSHAYIIASWIFDRLKTDPFFENFLVTRISSALPVELWSQVPFLGVYLIEDPLTPPGGISNQGMIAFVHNVRVGFQFILRNNEPDVLLRDLDRVKHFIMRTILRDDRFTNRFNTGMAGKTAFNGISSGRVRAPRWGTNGGKNETPIGEQEIELSFTFETIWYPYGFDDLERIDITTGFPGPGATPEEREEIEQVKIVYIFDPDTGDSVSPPLPPDTPAPGPPPGSP